MATAPALDPLTAEALREAIGAARAGDLNSARTIARGALDRGGDRVALHAFLGMVEARAGELATAVIHLREAHRGRPADAIIASNLIAAQIDCGDLEGAFQIATKELALSDASLRIARYRGFLAQSLQHFEEAAEAYAFVVARAPDDAASWNNLGNARLAIGDGEASVAALKKAAELDPQSPPTRLNLAAALQSADRTGEAEEVLRDAAGSFPEDALPLYELYVLLKREGRHGEALAPLEQAAERNPHHADYQFKLGVEYGLVRRVDEAERAFRNALAIDPKLRNAYLGLAVQYEHSNRHEEFAPLLELAQASGVDEDTLAFIRALELRREGRFQEALDSLSRVSAGTEPERSAHIRATILDRLGRTDEAFEVFSLAARLHQTHPTQPLTRAAELRSELRDEVRTLAPEWVASWSEEAADDGAPAPVFLVGFPRSGTTLLDTILMGHPSAVVLEEQPPLNRADSAIGGLAALPGMDAAAIAQGRKRYFDEVAKIAEIAPDQLLIDKSPLFLSKAPLIHRLFPNARFILALRHPCDVLLSCFMSNFRLNTAMSNFLRLEDAAEFYDLTFQHWERSRSLMPLNVHTVVYERLVEDVEGEVRPLFDFLGLEWRPEVLDHRRTARERGLITTASYSQVTEPIYRRAAGRWHRYREHLDPILPVLKPWVEKFGYTL